MTPRSLLLANLAAEPALLRTLWRGEYCHQVGKPAILARLEPTVIQFDHKTQCRYCWFCIGPVDM